MAAPEGDDVFPLANVRDMTAWTEEGDCETHGPYAQQRFGRARYRLGCPSCIAERERQEQLRQEQIRQTQDQWRQEERLDQSGLRGRFRDATFEHFNAADTRQRKVLAACQAFAAGPLNEWRSLVLVGPCGTGKTHLGAAMALTTIARGTSARMASAREIVRALRATWRRGSEADEESVISDYAGCGLLVVDELGVGFGSDGELTQLLDVIDRRYQLQRPIVAITNLSTKDLHTAVGDRIYDRLAETATVRACDWPSYRRRGGA